MTAVYAVLVDIFVVAGKIAFFMAITAKGINMIGKAFTRGEIVV